MSFEWTRGHKTPQVGTGYVHWKKNGGRPKRRLLVARWGKGHRITQHDDPGSYIDNTRPSKLETDA